MIYGKRGQDSGAIGLLRKIVLMLLVVALVVALLYIFVIKKGAQPIQNATECTSGTYFIFNGSCEKPDLCPEGTKAMGIGNCPPDKVCCIYTDLNQA